MKTWILLISLVLAGNSLLSNGGAIPRAYAETPPQQVQDTARFEGAIVQDVQITCVIVPELIELIRKQITIEPGDRFAPEQIRESIRRIYGMKRFSQITVEAEFIADDTASGAERRLRVSFCPVQIKTLAKLQITGNQTISANSIQQALDVKIGDQLPPSGLQPLKQRVLQLYRDHGYHQAQVTLDAVEETGGEKATLVVTIEEGRPSQIGSVTFEGQSVLTEAELMKASGLRPGTRFTLNALERGIERIKQRYAAHGYFRVKVTGRDMQYNFDTGEIDLRLTLEQGEPTTIRFEGNERITTKRLKRLVQMEKLQEDLPAETVNELTDYYLERGFAFVEIEAQTLEEDSGPVIRFTIHEGPQVRVRSITIGGNATFSDKQLRKQMLTKTQGFLRKGFYREKIFEEDILAIKAFYRQHGYLEAEVVSVSKDFSAEQTEVALGLHLREGVQTRIEAIHLTGEPEADVLEKLRKQLLLKSGEPLNVELVTQSIDRMKEFYANRGHIQAKIDVAPQFSEDNRQVNLTFRIDPGPIFYIGDISIQGVINTRKTFVTRELQVEKGDIYSSREVRETVRRLNQLGFYDNVTFRRLDPKSSDPEQDMLLSVNEISAKDVKFGVGYSTDRGEKGFVEYSDKNVLNYGGKGTARAELSLERPKLTLQYLHPHFVTQDTRLAASVFDDIRKDNESFDVERRGGRLAVQHDFSWAWSGSIGYYFHQADPSNVDEAAQLSVLDTQVLNIGGLNAHLTWDGRDDMVQPKHGGLTHLYVRTAHDMFGAETDFWELSGQMNWYLNPFQQFVLACSLNGKMIEPTNGSTVTPIYLRYFLGGDSTVRGFSCDSVGPTAEDADGKDVHIGGDRLVRFNAEWRFPIYRVLGGVVFYDAGANWLDAEGFDRDKLREGAGVGLRVSTPVGPLRLDYGWKLDRREGESAGEYYITIGSAF